ncbi:Kap114p [Sugiyamaella lignohabitans]|uniref:Kap114p n=1 Tax=Sugiyamaella lignohabitans TaxID=796027 RepID=A0A167DTI4_9ASCO|nr:Kap114p [Sugiyamaella lignohabitans]ANB13276.1 Kap114p [Sugiyamaella lignohabitans]
MEINPSYIESLLIGVQSNDSDIRKSSESLIYSLSEKYVADVVTSLVSVALDNTRPVGLRQGAILMLKVIILRSWSIGFDQFVGPPISIDIKDHVRSEVLKLISDEEQKIRSVAALLVAKIASVDFPDEWPGLLNIVKSQLESSKNEIMDGRVSYALEGTLTVLNELLNDALSENDFFVHGPEILASLLGSLRLLIHGPADVRLWKLSALVVQCFTACIQFLLMAEDHQQEALDQAAKDIIHQWSKPFLDILYTSNYEGALDPIAASYDSPLSVAIMETKIEVISALRELESAFPSFMHRTKLPELFKSVWSDWISLANVWPHCTNLSETAGQAMTTLVMEQIEFLATCIGSNAEIRLEITNLHALTALASTAVTYASLTNETANVWDDDCNEFVTIERELSLDRNPRTEILPLVVAVKSPNLYSVLWHTRQEDNATQMESILYLLDGVIKEVSVSSQKIDSSFLASLVDALFIFQGPLPDAAINRLLKVRATILGSTISKNFGARIDNNTVRYRFLHNTLEALSDENATIKIAALISFNVFSKSFKDLDLIKSRQNEIFACIVSLTDEATGDTPAMLVEILLDAIRLDFQAAFETSASDILRLLFTLASKDTANIELTTEVQEMLEEITENATLSEESNHLYSKICAEAIPLLLTNITATVDGSFSPDLILSLDLLGSLVDRGPEVLPPAIVDATLQPIFRLIQISDDALILQSASTTFTYLVEHGFQQIARSETIGNGQSGTEAVLSVASKLLDPSWEDSAALASGRLVIAIINKYGVALGNLLPRLLDATVRRLIQAENLSLVESLVSVFCLLVLQSPQEVVDILASIQLSDENKSALDGVLTKWLSTFEYVRGYDEIRRNVVALQKLYMLNDSRVKAVLVDGDLEVVPKDVIITRSKAKNLKYSQISAQEKIVKLLIKELSTTPSAAEGVDLSRLKSVGNDDIGDDEDDGWEDDFTDSIVPASTLNSEDFTGQPPIRHLDTETYSIILDWFKQISNANEFQGIYHNLTDTEQGILKEQMQR